MGKATRLATFVNDKRLSHVPGPNNYYYPAKDKTIQPSWTSSKDKRFVDRKFGSPGPGNYEHRVHTADGPQYSQRPKPPVNPLKNRTITGPGDYSPSYSSAKKSAPAFSIRLKTDSKKFKVSPGPGSYEDGRSLYYQTIPGSKMGNEIRKGDFLKTASH